MLEALTAQGVFVLAVLRQPVGSSKLFQGFKRAARKSSKAEDGVSYALTAASSFVKGKFSTDPLASNLKLSAPGVYTGSASSMTKCKIGRPTEMTVDAMEAAISACAAEAATAKPKAEL